MDDTTANANFLSKKRRSKVYKNEELKQLSRDDLEDYARQLSAHNTQLQALLRRTLEDKTAPAAAARHRGKNKKERPFDFSKHPTRHVLLKFAYLGWDYDGYTIQEDTLNTIENILFDALFRVKLVPDRETANYHRCGRTDKGVSAFSQVVSLTIRSKLPLSSDGSRLQGEEINYVELLNRVLPQQVRMLAWSTVPEGFSARFDCTSRTYKYFFPMGSLNIQRMQEAGKLLEGTHDLRNLCKMDVGNGVTTFRRTIDEVAISLLQDDCAVQNEKLKFDSCANPKVEIDNKAKSNIDNRFTDDIGSKANADSDASKIKILQSEDEHMIQDTISGFENIKQLKDIAYNEEKHPVHMHSEQKTIESWMETNLDSNEHDPSQQSNLSQRDKNLPEQIHSCKIKDCNNILATEDPTLNGTNTSSCSSGNKFNFNKVNQIVLKASLTSAESCSSNTSVLRASVPTESESNNLCVATIRSRAFLWHQIRAMMAVLILVGEEKEQPSIVTELFDIENNPCRPQYSLASEVPLCLFVTEYPSDIVQWQHCPKALERVETDLQNLWAQHAIRSGMVKRMIVDVSRMRQESSTEQDHHHTLQRQHYCLTPAAQAKVYQPLLKRKTCGSLEERMEHFAKRRRWRPEAVEQP